MYLQKETEDIRNHLTQAIRKGGGSKPFYISGLPGTGKTAAVCAVVKALKAESAKGTLPFFEFVTINGLKMKQPTDAYSALWKAGILRILCSESI